MAGRQFLRRIGVPAVLGACVGCASPPPANVVVVLVDTLRADHLGCYGYARATSPNLDRLASEGVLFESAIAQSSWTSPSVASLFTSVYPTAHGGSALAEKNSRCGQRAGRPVSLPLRCDQRCEC